MATQLEKQRTGFSDSALEDIESIVREGIGGAMNPPASKSDIERLDGDIRSIRKEQKQVLDLIERLVNTEHSNRYLQTQVDRLENSLSISNRNIGSSISRIEVAIKSVAKSNSDTDEKVKSVNNRIDLYKIFLKGGATVIVSLAVTVGWIFDKLIPIIKSATITVS